MSTVTQRGALSFALWCAVLASGLFLLKEAEGVGSGLSGPEADSPRYAALARVAPAPMASAAGPDLRAGDQTISLGEASSVEFSTDARGVGRVPMSLGMRTIPGKRPLALAHRRPNALMGWSGSELVLAELRPGARYQMSVALWYYGQESPAAGQTKPPVWRVFKKPGPGLADCGAGCVASFGEPTLVALDSGPWWRAAEVRALALGAWLAPLYVGLVALVWWRGRLRPLLRRAQVAFGGSSRLPLPAAGPVVG